MPARNRAVTTTVSDAAWALAALSLLAALVGGWCWSRGRPAAPFWILLRASQAGAVLYAVGVGVLAAAGRYSADHLFYLYALLPTVIGFVAEQLRLTSAQTVLDQRGLEDAQAVGRLDSAGQREVVAAIVSREVAVMALAGLVAAFLFARAAGTAHGF